MGSSGSKPRSRKPSKSSKKSHKTPIITDQDRALLQLKTQRGTIQTRAVHLRAIVEEYDARVRADLRYGNIQG
jgi:hypothetical protein